MGNGSLWQVIVLLPSIWITMGTFPVFLCTTLILLIVSMMVWGCELRPLVVQLDTESACIVVTQLQSTYMHTCMWPHTNLSGCNYEFSNPLTTKREHLINLIYNPDNC